MILSLDGMFKSMALLGLIGLLAISPSCGGPGGGGGGRDLKDDLRREYNRNPGKYRDKYIDKEHWYVPAGVRN